jgi:CheY-like chemotaxis protein
MKTLIVEDDFTSRLFLQTVLSRYGECHIAVNGKEAVEAHRTAGEDGKRYDLICMDIMMPEIDGREAVKQVRALEEARGIFKPSLLGSTPTGIVCRRPRRAVASTRAIRARSHTSRATRRRGRVGACRRDGGAAHGVVSGSRVLRSSAPSAISGRTTTRR